MQGSPGSRTLKFGIFATDRPGRSVMRKLEPTLPADVSSDFIAKETIFSKTRIIATMWQDTIFYLQSTPPS